MTPDQIIHARRAHVLDQAALLGVTAACRAAGVSRTSYYKWVAKAEKYGLSALLPKDRRPPVMPNACLLYTSPSPRDLSTSRMPSSA